MPREVDSLSKADLEDRIAEWEKLKVFWHGKAAMYKLRNHPDSSLLKMCLAELKYLEGLIAGYHYRLNNGLYDQTSASL